MRLRKDPERLRIRVNKQSIHSDIPFWIEDTIHFTKIITSMVDITTLWYKLCAMC